MHSDFITSDQNLTRRAHVFVIDDEQDFADRLAYYLEAYGYRVTVSYDGHEIIKKISEEQTAVVLLH